MSALLQIGALPLLLALLGLVVLSAGILRADDAVTATLDVKLSVRGMTCNSCVTTVKSALEASAVSGTVNTVFVERHNGTDRNRNARKVRKTYAFSKDWDVHEAMTYFATYSYNFCWPVRTLRQKVGRRRYRQRTPAMAAKLTDHVWTLQEWLSFPAVQRK